MTTNTAQYTDFLAAKSILAQPSGFTIDPATLSSQAFDWQKAITRWALQCGKAAVFARYGLGKTLIQLMWADAVCRETKGNVLILAPLAVARQTAEEGAKFGINVAVCRSQNDVAPGINVTNYDLLHKFDASAFRGIALDESSILKHIDSKTRTHLIETFKWHPYKLCCTATPSPNDHTELGGHAEFLGVLTQSEMLSTFFYHDGGDTSQWYLKRHARQDFWRWVASWGVLLRSPADLGYDDSAYQLPPLVMHQHVIASQHATQGYLFPMEALTLTERRQARRESLSERVALTADLINQSSDCWAVWCNLNDESTALTTAIPDAVEVRGSDSPQHKEQAAHDFIYGRVRVMISKPSIFGFGVNWQHCHQTAFVGLSDSFEEIDQALHRFHRFGQQSTVHAHMVIGEKEGAVVQNIQKKRARADEMAAELVRHVAVHYDVQGLTRQGLIYQPHHELILPAWLSQNERIAA